MKKSIILLLIVLICSLCLVAGKKNKNKKPKTENPSTTTITKAENNTTILKNDDIIILATNDIHCAAFDDSASLGYAKIAQCKKEMQSKYNKVFLVDAGDAVHGDGNGAALGDLSKGLSIIKIMNAVGYDYAVLGNHEFLWGVSTIQKYLDNANFKYLCCNIKAKENTSPVELLKLIPYAVEEINDKKIAFVGLTTPEAVNKGPAGDWQILDNKELKEALQNTVNYAKNKLKADIVVLIAHIGLDSDTTDDPKTDRYTTPEIISDTTGIDIVIDGHSPVGVGEWTKSKKKEVNTTGFLKNKDGKKIVYCHTGKYGKKIAKISIPSDLRKQITATDLTTNDIQTEDATTLKLVNDLYDEINK